MITINLVNDDGTHTQVWNNIKRYAIDIQQTVNIVNSYGGRLDYDGHILFENDGDASLFVLKFY